MWSWGLTSRLPAYDPWLMCTCSCLGSSGTMLVVLPTARKMKERFYTPRGKLWPGTKGALLHISAQGSACSPSASQARAGCQVVTVVSSKQQVTPSGAGVPELGEGTPGEICFVVNSGTENAVPWKILVWTVAWLCSQHTAIAWEGRTRFSF